MKQRLKLAAVSPKLMSLYREGELTLDQLMAFTSLMITEGNWRCGRSRGTGARK